MNFYKYNQTAASLAMVSAMLSLACTQVHAQTKTPTATKSHSVQVPTEFSNASKRLRLHNALQSLWATTQPGKTYSISGVLFPRAMDGTFSSEERAGPYTFGPNVTANEMLEHGPKFVELLLRQYSDQELQALGFLESALASYFNTSAPGQKTQFENGAGSLTRNDDGTATYADDNGRTFLVIDPTTKGGVIATMAPNLAAALTEYSGAITPGYNNKKYATVDANDSNVLINHDGRVYDRGGRYLGNGNGNAIANGNGNGNGNGTGTGTGTGNGNGNAIANGIAAEGGGIGGGSYQDNPSSAQSSSPAYSDNPCHVIRNLNGGRMYCND